jgi:hypothetical protein
LAGVLAHFRSASVGRRALEGRLVLDSRIGGSPADRLALLALALRNGVRIDLWARSIPADESLSLLSAATGGRTYTDEEPRMLGVYPYPTVKTRTPLPVKATPPGRLGESLFSVFLDMGPYLFRDWLPLWADSLPSEKF